MELPSAFSLGSDEELLARFCKGETEAFGALVRRYEKELYGYLRRYVGDADLAEDVFQNTFLQVYTKGRQFEEGRSVRPWLYAIATNQAIDALRKAGRHPMVSLDRPAESGPGDDPPPSLVDALPGSEAGPLEKAQARERHERVRASVDRLPETLKQVLLLAYYQGMKYRDIADVLGIPVGTVKSRLHAALVKLQQIWDETPSLYEA